MSLWTTRYNTSPLWTEVEAARGRINRLVVVRDDVEAQDALAHAGMCIELLERRRSETDAQEVTAAMLERVRVAVVEWNGGLENVLTGAWTFVNLVSPTDAVLDALATWPPLKPSQYLTGIRAATDSFVAKVHESLSQVDADAAETLEVLDELKTAESALAAKVETETQRISEAIAAFKAESTASTTEVLAEKGEELDEFLGGWRTQREAYEENAEELIGSLKSHEESARKTVHATTALVVATDYGQYARNKNIAAWTCDIAAAIIGAAGVSAILYHLYTLDGTADGNVGLSITRLAASLGTLGIAALIGRRGAQHHKEARAAKRTDLALRRVMPFIVNLPEDEQQEIVLDFAERVFIRGDLDAATAETQSALRDRITAIRAARAAKAGSQA